MFNVLVSTALKTISSSATIVWLNEITPECSIVVWPSELSCPVLFATSIFHNLILTALAIRFIFVLVFNGISERAEAESGVCKMAWLWTK